MRNFYYYLTTVFFFLAYVSASAQPGCSSLEITATQDGAVCGSGSVRLEATSSGTGDGVFWYDAATGGSIVGQGSSIYTPEITATTSFWAAEGIFTGGTAQVGPVDRMIGTSTGSSIAIGTQRMFFDVHDETTLISVDIFPTAAVGTQGSVTIRDNNQVVLYDIPYTTTVTGGLAQTIVLNANLQPGTDYEIGQGTAITLHRNSTGAVYPYTSPKISITGNSFNPVYYYWYYNWEYSDLVVDCESPRVEAVATVNNIADEDIASLPYTHTSNSGSYDNNYSDAPGVDCGTDDAYLYGSDVVYKFTADDDYILDVQLSGLSESYTGVFVYEDCADIGDVCAAEGSVSASTTNHGFQMSVENGKNYYFVVSSAEPTDSFDYTLDITGSTCANYPAPTADATQDFVDGQLLSDLTVNGLDLTWYSDAALNNVLPEDTPLVNATTYYVTQTFQSCESAYAAITVNELSCAVLNVYSTTANSVCGEGSVTLIAEGAEAVANTNIYWYDAASGGELVGKGNEFQTEPLEQTTSFWAAEVALSGGGELTGQGKPTHTASSPSGYTLTAGVEFAATEGFTITSVEAYSSSTAGGVIPSLQLQDGNGQMIEELLNVTVPAGGTGVNAVPFTIELNFEVPGPGTYRLTTVGSHASLVRDSGTAGNVYPYLLGDVGEITSGILTSNTSTSYYYFYNWSIGSEDVLCESARLEVIAEVNNIADEMVTEPMPYVHTANTSDYGNNYFGAPGSNCTTDDYLDGNDVVYQFSPTVGGVYSIGLSGLSSNNAGVFVFESCYDIGSNCYIGEVSDGTSNDFGINEVVLNDGQDYFIVISTKASSSTAYTLTIDEAQIDCSDYTAAPQGDTNQFSEIGDTLADLNVIGSNLTWYSDASLSTVIPDSTPTVDGATYYVTQTLNGCESDDLEVTTHEVDCSALEIVSTVGATIVCKGSATLEALGSGTFGGELYWFDAATDGNLLTIGNSYTTPEISQSKSYWVTEVFVEQGSAGSGSLPTYCTPTFNTGCTSRDTIDDFILEDNSGSVLISHLGTGCSAGAYGDYTGDASLNANLVAGGTYNFEATHGTGSQYLRIWIDFDGNGSFEDDGELVYVATSAASASIPSMGSFEIPQNIVTRNTVMRVKTTWSTGASNSCTQTGAFGEAHDYKVTLVGADVVCESPRVEVVAEVTQDGNEIVGTLPYTHSENTGTYGNNYFGTPGANCGGVDANYLNGSDVVYMFEATEDDLITIELTDLNQYYAGVFVYDSCGSIMDECAAGAVAGPSTDDIVIQDFPVVDGQTYYIVVSSWLTTDIDYTININSFSCADLEPPTGDATQSFVAGDTVEDLDAQGTRNGAVLTWYEDAALSTEITDTSTHALVDAVTYYVTQTYNDCESVALAITAEEVDCSNLDIVSVVDAEVACRGSVELTVTASGTGSEIYWYDAPTGGNILAMGSKYTTPELTQTTSYWAAEVYTEQGNSGSNVPLPTYCTPAPISSGCNVNDLIDDFILEDNSGTILISHLGTGCSANAYGDYTGDSSLTANLVAGGTYNFEVTHGTSSQYLRIWIDLDGNGSFEDAGELLFHSTTGGSANAPTVGTFEIPQDIVSGVSVMRIRNTFSSGIADSCTQSSSYGEVHDYKVVLIGAEVICESPRQEVVATVNQSGDIAFEHTDLTYIDTNNTSMFGNNFTGDAGDGCDGDNYLNGNEVMYYYTANPTDDDILRIEVSNFSNPNTAVFVYSSCGDIGINCLAGATNDNGEIVIEDYYVNAGDNLLILVTSSTGSTDYTLTVEGIECNNVAPPTGDAAPYFIVGDMVSDLEVLGSTYNDGFVWYSDAALTNEIIDPTTEPIVNGNSYFVTQTILGCESTGLEIVPIEFDCGLMGVDVTQDVVYTCSPGGDVILHAESSKIGSEVFWYDAEVGGNYLGKGSPFTIEIDQNRSIWASEVYLAGEAYLMGQGRVEPAGVSTFGSTLNYGLKFDVFEDFNLHSVDVYPNVSGNIEISLFDSSGNLLNSKTQSVTSSVNDPVTVILDFNVPVGTEYRLLQTSNPSLALVRDSSGNDFPYDLGVNGQYGQITYGTYGSMGTTNSSSYYYFYNWVVGEQEVICESSREEIQVVMNEDITPPPVVTPLQTICGEALLSEIIVLGTDIRWYDKNGTELSRNSMVVEGMEYYVTQTINACESAMTQVVMSFSERSDQPVAAINQAFLSGEDLTALEVFGDNLNWYADKWKLTPLPPTTPLQDQTTYYVTQTSEDKCESETLGITVHETLGLEDILFEAFEFYPNPVDEVLFISNSQVIDEIEIFDLSGRKVYSNKYNRSSIEIDVTRLSTGTYLLKAKIDDMEKIFRVIKK